jgi:hypothetical protein
MDEEAGSLGPRHYLHWPINDRRVLSRSRGRVVREIDAIDWPPPCSAFLAARPRSEGSDGSQPPSSRCQRRRMDDNAFSSSVSLEEGYPYARPPLSISSQIISASSARHGYSAKIGSRLSIAAGAPLDKHGSQSTEDSPSAESDHGLADAVG